MRIKEQNRYYVKKSTEHVSPHVLIKRCVCGFGLLKMSSRAFRRLGGDSFTIKLPAALGGEGDDEEDDGEELTQQPLSLQSQKKNNFNPFDMVK